MFRLPNDTQRLSIIGRTGSGKTQAGVWHLSKRSFDIMPWIVFNFKGDDLINSIPGTRDLSMTSNVPNYPGIYVIDVAPDEKEVADEFLMRVWKHEKCGLYIDEGYMLSGLPGFRRCLTQGRSKRIPIILLSQRPVWMDRFAWSEADFFQIFNVAIADDKKTIASYVGGQLLGRTPEFHSNWYDVGQDQTFRLLPVPDRASILAVFRERIGTKRKLL